MDLTFSIAIEICDTSNFSYFQGTNLSEVLESWVVRCKSLGSEQGLQKDKYLHFNKDLISSNCMYYSSCEVIKSCLVNTNKEEERYFQMSVFPQEYHISLVYKPLDLAKGRVIYGLATVFVQHLQSLPPSSGEGPFSPW